MQVKHKKSFLSVWFWAGALQKCLVYKNFNLCERCLRTKHDAQINNQNETIFHFQNHSHPLKLCVSDKKWKCDGVTVFGRCKAEMRCLPRVKRYKCTKCENFDLCDQCLKINLSF